MAEERIVIVVTSEGVQETAKGLRALKDAAAGSGTAAKESVEKASAARRNAFLVDAAAEKRVRQELIQAANADLATRLEIEQRYQTAKRTLTKANQEVERKGIGVIQETYAQQNRRIAAEQRATAQAQIAAVRQWGAEWKAQHSQVSAAHRSDIAAIRQWGAEWKAQQAAVRAGERARHAEQVAQQRNVSGARNALFTTAGAVGAAFIGASALREVVILTDAYQNLANRINLVTESDAERGAVTKEVFAIALRTRTSLEATGQVYQRLATSVQGFGVSQREALKITESLGKAAVVGGSNFIEAEKGLFQFTQGLSRGQLRGDELRSVLEQLPGVADVLAKSLGVTRQGLATLAEQGKITTQVIIKAFQDAREEIEGKFAKTVPTIGQAFAIMRTQIVRFMGDVQNTSGAFGIISLSIVELSKNIEYLARVVIGITFYKSIFLVGNLLVTLFSGPASMAKLIIGLSSAFIAVTADAKSFKFVMDGIKEHWELLRAVGGSVFVGGITALAVALGSGGLAGAVGTLTTALTALSGVAIVRLLMSNPAAMIAGLTAMAMYGAHQANKPGGYMNPRRPAKWAGQGVGTAAFGDPGFVGPGTEEEESLKRILGGGDGTNIPKTDKVGRKTFADHLKEIQNEIDLLRMSRQERAIQERVLQVEESLRGHLTATQREQLRVKADELQMLQHRDAFKEHLRELSEENDLLAVNVRYRGAAALLMAADRKVRDTDGRGLSSSEAGDVLGQFERGRKQNAINRIVDPYVESQRAAEEATEALGSAAVRSTLSMSQLREETNKARLEALSMSNDFKSGVMAGFIQVDNQLLNVADSASNAVVGAFNTATDAVLNFVKTGKLEIGSFIEAIISDFARLAIQQGITGPLFGAFQSVAQGWGWGGGAAVSANVGATGSNRAVLPQSSAVGGRGESAVVIEVQTSPDGKARVQETRGMNNERNFKVFVAAVGSELAEGGHMDAQMKLYGLRKVGLQA